MGMMRSSVFISRLNAWSVNSEVTMDGRTSQNLVAAAETYFHFMPSMRDEKSAPIHQRDSLSAASHGSHIKYAWKLWTNLYKPSCPFPSWDRELESSLGAFCYCRLIFGVLLYFSSDQLVPAQDNQHKLIQGFFQTITLQMGCSFHS
jgi:hypothetical protein